jgi:ADP-ribose pyrophosphatase YjhB (NUDIX family)
MAKMEPNAASVALLEGPRVLLIRRAFEPLKGLWTLPGGRREADESIEATAIRELREELGVTISDLVPVCQLSVAGRFRLQVFATRQFGGRIVASDEVADWAWMEPGPLAGYPTTPGLADVLDRAFKAVAV